MKVDFKNKTIEITEPMSIKEFMDIVNKYNLNDFELIKSKDESITLSPTTSPEIETKTPYPFIPYPSIQYLYRKEGNNYLY